MSVARVCIQWLFTLDSKRSFSTICHTPCMPHSAFSPPVLSHSLYCNQASLHCTAQLDYCKSPLHTISYRQCIYTHRQKFTVVMDWELPMHRNRGTLGSVDRAQLWEEASGHYKQELLKPYSALKRATMALLREEQRL